MAVGTAVGMVDVSGSHGQQFKRLDVARPHRAEVAVVERGELRLAQPLGHGQDGTVEEADFEIGYVRIRSATRS
jgi:hypothetical protein